MFLFVIIILEVVYVIKLQVKKWTFILTGRSELKGAVIRICLSCQITEEAGKDR